MVRIVYQPHDTFFRQAMRDLRVAREFIEKRLPAALLKQVSWQTLKLENTSFIDDELKNSAADLVYSVRIGDFLAVIYILCEHQSQPDYWMAFRLIKYIIRIMDHRRLQHPTEPLPLIYPLVVYSGKVPWNSSRDLFDLFGEQAPLARELLFRPYDLVDIARCSDDELKQERLSGLVQFALKYQQVRDLVTYLETVFPWMNDLEHTRDDFLANAVLNYIIDGIEADDERLFVEKAQSLLSEKLKGEAMTLAQRFEQKGRQEGLRQGMQQGIQQGRQEGLQQGIQKGAEILAAKLLTDGMPLEKVAQLTELPTEKLRQLVTDKKIN